MKKWTLLLLLLALMLPVLGCSQTGDPPDNAVIFYYRRAEFSHGSPDSLIVAEYRVPAQNLMGQLNQYAAGPVTEGLVSIFPLGGRIVKCDIHEDVAYVTVSDEFAALSRMELTVSCACITKTVMGLTHVTGVQIQAENALLGNNQYLFMDADSLLLFDGSAQE